MLFNPTAVITLYHIHLLLSLPSQNTREKETVWPFFLLVKSRICVFPDEHRLNSARLCLIILTCIAEVGAATLLQHLHLPQVVFVLTSPLCVIGPVRRCLSS